MTSPHVGDRPSRIVQFFKAIGGVLTVGAAVVGAAAAAGFFDDSAPQTVVIPQETTSLPRQEDTATSQRSDEATTPLTTSTTSAVVQPTEPDRAAVDLVYRGDVDGCALGISVSIGDQVATPIGSSFRIHDVPVGPQPYSIAGTIQCPTIGWCDAQGAGSVDVVGGRALYVVWQNTGPGTCSILLSTT